MFVTSAQLVAPKLKLCCKTKFVEGISQESWRPFIIAIFKIGEGADWDIQIPPPEAAATSWLPSADDATDVQMPTADRLFELHVLPESVEVKILLAPLNPLAAAINFTPSADVAMETKS